MSDTCNNEFFTIANRDHSGASHEYTILNEWMNTTVVLCIGHANEYKIIENYPLPNPCNCRICNS